MLGTVQDTWNYPHGRWPPTIMLLPVPDEALNARSPLSGPTLSLGWHCIGKDQTASSSGAGQQLVCVDEGCVCPLRTTATKLGLAMLVDVQSASRGLW